MMQSEQSFTAAGLNLIGQGLTIFDRDLRLVIANSRFQTMFNFPDAMMRAGTPFEDAIRFVASQGDYGEIGDLDAFVRERVAIARTFNPHYMERKRANGRVISVEGAPLPQGGWVAVYTDITRIRQQEAMLSAKASDLSDQVGRHAEALAATNRQLAATNAALEETKRQLIESEARMRLTTEMVPAHIAHIDAAQRYTFSNGRLSAVLPNRPSEIVGKAFASVIGETAYAKVAPHLERAFNGHLNVFEFTDEESGRRLRVAFNPDGEGGVYIMSMDITIEAQTREALQQTRKRELAAQLTSGLAHDFSNLLTIILGLQAKLKSQGPWNEEALHLIESSQAAAKRGGVLLDNIANVTSRVPRPTLVQVEAFLTELAHLAKPSFPSGLRLTVTSKVLSDAILIDRGGLQDALLNLIFNARDACGDTGQVSVVAREIGQVWIEFEVTDTGPGFTQTALKHAADPFFTTKGSQGSGLGLAMVFDMAKMAGGELRLSNSTDGGAVVRLRLPLHIAPKQISGLSLVVDDDAGLRMRYRTMLMELGLSVVEADSVEEAQKLLRHLPDIRFILTDLRLAGQKTGADLAREAPKTASVIIMTSLPAHDPLHVEARTLAPILTKPFEADDLHALLNTEVAA